MAWQSLAEDLEAEFSALQTWDPGPPEPRKAVRPAPPPDKRLAALEAAATALLRAAGADERLERQRARVRAWCRAHQQERSEQQRARREARREPSPEELRLARNREYRKRWLERNLERERERCREAMRERRKKLTAGTG